MAGSEEHEALEGLVQWTAGKLASLMGLDTDEADSAVEMARSVFFSFSLGLHQTLTEYGGRCPWSMAVGSKRE